MGMWFRGLLSFLCLVLGVSAFVLWDCATSVVDVVASDPLGLCATVAGLGIAQLGWMAGGLAVIALVAFGLIWIPVIRATRHGRKAQPERALLANLARLGEGPVLIPIDDTVVDNFDLRCRVEVVEVAFGPDAAGGRELTGEWLALLREANRRHNDGRLSTAEFMNLNTRLLDVISPEGDRAGASY